MTAEGFVRWSRTDLDDETRAELLGGLTPAQRRSLLERDHAWLARAGVIWTPPDGRLRRALYTHSASFETRLGTFRIDSEGGVVRLPDEPPPH